jgi:NOL1/NOP2/fmu family ribosome biogenesis protein
MTTEKLDPWALLREARNELSVLASYVEDPDTKWTTVGLKVTAKAQKKLRDSIEAALAGRQDSATDVVEWTTDAFGNNYVKQGNVLLQVAETIDGRWAWGMRVEGDKPTLDEAKSAAIAAAKGL